MGDEKRQARTARLRYVTDAAAGIRRVRHGSGFQYRRGAKVVRDVATLRRIRGLAIPPAWQDVWICSQANGHIQAIGRDQRGRKQYRYHPRWQAVRDEAKYDHMAEFAAVLPKIRAGVGRDLRRPGLPRQKVLAAVVRLLETSHIRVGNDEYARSNGSFGLTTFRDKHARFSRGGVRFHFHGKGSKWHEIDIADKRLAKIVRACQDLPGQQLFQYRAEDGSVCGIGSADVNEYVRELAGGDFTAKDFRTWSGTVRAARALRDLGCCETAAQVKRAIVAAIRDVANDLGNTPAVCRKCYIHPRVIVAFEEGRVLAPRGKRSRGGLSAEERAVLALLKS